LIGAGSYLLIRFGLGWLLRHFTVHRGMFHSLPVAGVFFLLAFLLASGQEVALRWYKAGGVLLGYMSHLVLDELYSLEWVRGRWKLRRSFGTALKLWGSHAWSNLLSYGVLGLLVVVAFFEPTWMESVQRQYVEAQAQFWQSQRQRLAALENALTQPHSRTNTQQPDSPSKQPESSVSGQKQSPANPPPQENPTGAEPPAAQAEQGSFFRFLR
ncbi:MAG: metal-dependent hydrolase, partial [Thermoguttaceae bacterium]|nr:metal-dependent hydrolase [Thermoguttaceae bacterium]